MARDKNKERLEEERRVDCSFMTTAPFGIDYPPCVISFTVAHRTQMRSI